MLHFSLMLLNGFGCENGTDGGSGNTDNNGGGGDADTDADADTDTDTDADTDTGGNQTGPATLRALNLFPAVDPVDVLVEGAGMGRAPAIAALTYPNLGMADIPAMDQAGARVTFVPAGGAPTDALATAQNVDLTAAAISTVALIGDTPATLTTVAFRDTRGNLAEGDVRMRFVEAAIGLGPVDVFLVGGAGAPAAPAVEGLAFGDTEIVDVTAPAVGTMLGIDVDQSGTPDLMFALPDLPAGIDLLDVFLMADAAGPFVLFVDLDGGVVRVDAGAGGGGTGTGL